VRFCSFGTEEKGLASKAHGSPQVISADFSLENKVNMKISIFGLGYVGTVCAGCFVSEGHTVIGVDVNASKVDGMNAGVASIVEPEIQELFDEDMRPSNLRRPPLRLRPFMDRKSRWSA